MTMAEPQDSVNTAAAKSAYYHAELVARLPKWRQWLIRKLSPPQPFGRAEIPPGRHVISEPLKVPPGVLLTGLWVENAGSEGVSGSYREVDAAAGFYEHRGMGICNKGRTHYPPCDFGSGL